MLTLAEALEASPQVTKHNGVHQKHISVRQVELLQERGVSRIVVQVLEQGVHLCLDQSIIVRRVGSVQPLERFVSCRQHAATMKNLCGGPTGPPVAKTKNRRRRHQTPISQEILGIHHITAIRRRSATHES